MLKKSILVLTGLLVLLVCALPAAASQERLISTTGEATCKIKPDLAKILLVIECEKKDVAEVQKENNRIMNSFNRAMLHNGVKKSDIQTVSFQITPVQKYEKNSDKRKIIAYRATQQILLTTNQLDKLGLLTAQALNSGITRVQKISYDLANPNSAAEKAVALAVNNARQKALSIAKAAGLTIKGISRIQESNSYINRPNDFFVRALSSSAKAEANEDYSEALEIANPDLIEVQSRVQIDFIF